MWKVYITQQNIKAQILPIHKAESVETYCVFQKHANSEVQKQQTHTKWIGIHQSKITNHDLLNLLKQTFRFWFTLQKNPKTKDPFDITGCVLSEIAVISTYYTGTSV